MLGFYRDSNRWEISSDYVYWEVKWMSYVEGHNAQPSLLPSFVEHLQSHTKHKSYQVKTFLLLRDVSLILYSILYDGK